MQQARLPAGGEGTELGWGAKKVWKRKEGMDGQGPGGTAEAVWSWEGRVRTMSSHI